jgi:NitT/TauT family transport system permease protein
VEAGHRGLTAAPARARGRGQVLALARRHDGAILGSATVIAVVGVWELAAATGALNPFLFSAPSRVAAALVELAATGELLEHARVSGLEFALGFGLAALAGVPLGFAASVSERLRWSVEPLLGALNATPTVALIPLFIIWFGIGLWDKVAIVFLGAFIQIALSTLSGSRLVSANLLRVARSFAATRRRTLLTVVLPSSIPFILVGLRLGLGRALVGVVAAEFVASTAGLGFMITRAGSYFQTPKVFAGILIVSALGIAGTWLIQLTERRVEAWRPRVSA